MASANNEGSRISGSILTILGIVFIVLKLCHVIDWSWIWVLAPFWIPLLVALVIITLVMVTITLVALIGGNYAKKKR